MILKYDDWSYSGGLKCAVDHRLVSFPSRGFQLGLVGPGCSSPVELGCIVTAAETPREG